MELVARGREDERCCLLERDEGAYEGACDGASLRSPAGVGA